MDQLQPIPRRPDSIGARSLNTIDVAPAAVTVDIPGLGLKRDYAGLLEYWQMVRRHKGAMILAIFIGGLIGFLVILGSPRIYQGKTTLEIQGINQEFLNMKNVNPVSQGSSYLDTDIQTQVKLLQSRALLNSVRQKLEPRKPAEGLQPPDRLGVWRKALKMNAPDSDALWRQVLGVAARNVKVRSSGTNRIVEVTCDSTNAQLTADFCNTLTQEFIDQNLEARWKTTEYTGQWLTKQLGDLKIKLEKQEEELQSYARATGLVFTADKGDAQQAQLADFEKELSAARADRIGKQSKYEMAASSPPDALPDVLDDVSLKDSQKTLADLKVKLAQLRVTFTPSHAEVKKAQAEITAIEATLEASRSNILTRIGKEYEGAQRREKLLADTYAAQARLVSGKAEEVAHYSLLKRDVDATRLLYETLLQRLKEASIASALRANNIRVVDAAERPPVPYKPDVFQTVMVGLLFGSVAGIAFAVVRERADRTLQDPGDLSYYLGVSELGVVPLGDLLGSAKARTGPKSRSRALKANDPSSIARLDSGVEMISFRHKSSPLAESFRTALTSILFSSRNGERPRVLVLTSAGPKEGKTTTVANLGIIVSEIQRRVLVVDADLRRPRLHAIFNLDNHHGLSNLLMNKAPLDAAQLEAACAPTPVPGLYVLPSGSSRAHASSLLYSERLPEVLKLAGETFDTIIIDTPPMVNIADARILARLGDALVLVVRSGVTTRDAAQLAKARFADDGTPILGAILNFWNPKTPGFAYYTYYDAAYYPSDGPGNSDGSGPPKSDALPEHNQHEAPRWKPILDLPPRLGDGVITRESET